MMMLDLTIILLRILWLHSHNSAATLAKAEIIYPKNVGALVVMKFTQNELSAPIAIEKIKNLGALLELPAKQHCQFGQFSPILRNKKAFNTSE